MPSVRFLMLIKKQTFILKKWRRYSKSQKGEFFLEGYGQNESSYNDRKHTKLLIYINIHKHYNELITFIIISQYYTAKTEAIPRGATIEKLYPVEQKKRHCPERLICHN